MAKLLDLFFRAVAFVFLARLFWPMFVSKPLQAFIAFAILFCLVCACTPGADSN